MRLGRPLISFWLVMTLFAGNALYADPPRVQNGYTKVPLQHSEEHTTTNSKPPADYGKPSLAKPPIGQAPAGTRSPPTGQTGGPADYGKPTIPNPIGQAPAGTRSPPAGAPGPAADYGKPLLANPPIGQAQPSLDYGKPPLQAQQSGTMGKPSQQPVARSQADVAIAKGQSKLALDKFDADQKRFRAPPVAVPVSSQAAQQSPAWQQYGNRWGSANDYYAARQRAEARLPQQINHYYREPPAWVQSGPPSYGQFAAPFLGGALLGMAGTAAYDSWYYSRLHDPRSRDDILRWHEDMERQAADNEDLRAKLAVLDARTAQLEAQHAPITDKLPDDIDPALVIAPHTVMLATAKSGLNWWIWGPLIVVISVGLFLFACVMVSRNRQRIA